MNADQSNSDLACNVQIVFGKPPIKNAVIIQDHKLIVLSHLPSRNEGMPNTKTCPAASTYAKRKSTPTTLAFSNAIFGACAIKIPVKIVAGMAGTTRNEITTLTTAGNW